MRILGIDCGSSVTGYGVIDCDGPARRPVTFGAIRLANRAPLPEKLRAVADGIQKVVADWNPDEVAVEEVFTGVNSRSAILLAHVRGVALLSASRAGLPVASYTASQVKGSVTGYGNAGKEQVRLMVQHLLELREQLEPLDVSDALAVACCHASLRQSSWKQG